MLNSNRFLEAAAVSSCPEPRKTDHLTLSEHLVSPNSDGLYIGSSFSCIKAILGVYTPFFDPGGVKEPLRFSGPSHVTQVSGIRDLFMVQSQFLEAGVRLE